MASFRLNSIDAGVSFPSLAWLYSTAVFGVGPEALAYFDVGDTPAGHPSPKNYPALQDHPEAQSTLECLAV